MNKIAQAYQAGVRRALLEKTGAIDPGLDAATRFAGGLIGAGGGALSGNLLARYFAGEDSQLVRDAATVGGGVLGGAMGAYSPKNMGSFAGGALGLGLGGWGGHSLGEYLADKYDLDRRKAKDIGAVTGALSGLVGGKLLGRYGVSKLRGESMWG